MAEQQSPKVGQKRKDTTTAPLEIALSFFKNNDEIYPSRAKKKTHVEDNNEYEEDEPSSSLLANSEPRIVLSAEQQAAVDDVVLHGKSIFLTGDPGTGKSLVVEHIRAALARELARVVETTAPTGVAALNISGTTLQQWAGIGTASTDLLRVMNKKTTALQRVAAVDVLIIDEISMLLPSIFDELESAFRAIRQNEDFFGGVQLVLVGDFLQLPPVHDKTIESGDNDQDEAQGERRRPVRASQTTKQCFVFETETWANFLNDKNASTHVLTRSYRTQEDAFLKILSECRLGKLSTTSICKLEARRQHNLNMEQPPASCVRLFSRTADVDGHNQRKLSELDGEQRQFVSTDTINCANDADLASEFLARLPIDRLLILKKGARVMLRRNLWIDGGLVNGRCGTVVGFQASTALMVSLTEDDEEYLNATLSADDGCGGGDTFGRRINDYYSSSNGTAVNKRKKWIAELVGVPIVKFDPVSTSSSHEQAHSQTISVPLCEWAIERPRKLSGGRGVEYIEIAKRKQVPLTLSWAVSIHKSQGTTLTSAVISAGDVFVEGQAYVALSRVTTLGGIILRSFNPNLIRAHPKAVSWYRRQQQKKTPTF